MTCWPQVQEWTEHENFNNMTGFCCAMGGIRTKEAWLDVAGEPASSPVAHRAVLHTGISLLLWSLDGPRPPTFHYAHPVCQQKAPLTSSALSTKHWRPFHPGRKPQADFLSSRAREISPGLSLTPSGHWVSLSQLLRGRKGAGTYEHLLPTPAVLVLFRNSNFEENHEICYSQFREKARFREIKQFPHDHTAGTHREWGKGSMLIPNPPHPKHLSSAPCCLHQILTSPALYLAEESTGIQCLLMSCGHANHSGILLKCRFLVHVCCEVA